VETCDFRVSCLPGNPEAPGGEGLKINRLSRA